MWDPVSALTCLALATLPRAQSSWFSRRLADPGSLRPKHRMPLKFMVGGAAFHVPALDFSSWCYRTVSLIDCWSSGLCDPNSIGSFGLAVLTSCAVGYVSYVSSLSPWLLNRPHLFIWNCSAVKWLHFCFLLLFLVITIQAAPIVMSGRILVWFGKNVKNILKKEDSWSGWKEFPFRLMKRAVELQFGLHQYIFGAAEWKAL